MRPANLLFALSAFKFFRFVVEFPHSHLLVLDMAHSNDNSVLFGYDDRLALLKSIPSTSLGSFSSFDQTPARQAEAFFSSSSKSLFDYHRSILANAAAEAGSQLPPCGCETSPLCNTGGTSIWGENPNPSTTLKQVEAIDTLANHGFKKIVDGVTRLDYLRCTVNDFDNFDAAFNSIIDFCKNLDITCQEKDKGYLGYTNSISLNYWFDNSYVCVGHIAYSDIGNNKGGLIEFTGKCFDLAYSQHDHKTIISDLYYTLLVNNFRITRADIALDICSDLSDHLGITVPTLLRDGMDNGLFRSKYSPRHINQSVAQSGDWSGFITGAITIDSYNPSKHCPNGLTAYFGNRKSDNFWRIYEKGKQLAGNLDERDPSFFSGNYRNWIRVEREIKRGQSKKEIPLELITNTDSYFLGDGFDSLGKLVNAVFDWDSKDGSYPTASPRRRSIVRQAVLSISKKIYWAKQSYGRLIKTLHDLGIDNNDIFAMISRKSGLDEFLFDIFGEFGNEDTRSSVNF